MAYCVHCGVKLGDAERTCPLCGTEANDPNAPFDESAQKPYPVHTPEQTLHINRRYAVTLLSLLLLLPAALCIVLDLLGGRGITWSVYPAGVLVLIWIDVTVPMLVRHHRVYTTIVITTATLMAYLYMIEALSGKSGWFLPIVFPAMLLALGMICLMVFLIRSKRMRILRLMALGLVDIGVLSLFVELLCVWAGATHALTWSPYVIMPCFLLALLLYVASRNGPLSTELKRRFHF